MKKILATFAVILSLFCLIIAQSKQTSEQAEPNKKDIAVTNEIMKLEMEWDEASKNKVNPEVILKRVLAEDWYFTGPHGRIQNRQEVIASIKNNADRIDRTEFFDVRVRVYGDTAVTTGGAKEIGTRSTGEAYAEEYRWMDVFVKRKGHWQALVSQATLIPPRP
jgi:ketosteroid isomerase-like protein